MKHASKLVVLLVVTALLLGLAGVASAAIFSDIDGNTAANDIVKLNALDIINGYPDGTFKPEGNITRAEFAKIAVVAAGLKDSADLLKNTPSQFNDVKSGEWYTGWINLAASQGFLKGYPDGTFKPNDNITNAEVITVLMRVLGYNDNLPGDWPVDYIVKAATLGVTKNVVMSSNDLASRGIVAKLTSNTLDQESVDWDNTKEKFALTGKTILADKFDGAVTKNKVVRDWQYNSTKEAFQIKVLKVTDANDDGTLDTAADSVFITVNKDAKISGASDAAGLTNKMVDYLVNKDGEIVWAAVKDYGSVSTQKKDSNNFAVVDANGTQIKIYKTNYNLADGAAVDEATVAADLNADADQIDLLLIGANYSFANGQELVGLLDKDGNVAYVYAQDPGLPGIYKSYSATTKKITLKEDGDQGAPTIDLSKKDGNFRITRNGQSATVADLEADDLIVFSTNSKGYDVVITATSNTVSGTLNTATNDLAKVTVAGTTYDMAGNGGAKVQLSTDDGKAYNDLATLAQLDDVFEEDVTVALDKLGKVAYIKSSVAKTTDLYGVLDDVASTTGLGGTTVTAVTLLTPDGSKATYNVDKSSDWYTAGPPAAYKVAKGDMIKYSLKDTGKIGAPIIINTDLAGVNSTITGYDDKLGRLLLDAEDDDANDAYYYVTSSTVIFDPFAGTSNNKNEIVSVDSFKEALKGFDFTAGKIKVQYKVKDNVVQYIAAAEDIAWGASGLNRAVVLSTSYDGKYRIILNKEGETINYEVDRTNLALADQAAYDAAAKGDLVSYDLTGGKVSGYTTDEAKSTAIDGIVDKVDAATKSIKILKNDGTLLGWYSFDKDTVAYDVSGTDPAYTDFDGIGEGMEVSVSADANDILDWLVIK